MASRSAFVVPASLQPGECQPGFPHVGQQPGSLPKREKSDYLDLNGPGESARLARAGEFRETQLRFGPPRFPAEARGDPAAGLAGAGRPGLLAGRLGLAGPLGACSSCGRTLPREMAAAFSASPLISNRNRLGMRRPRLAPFHPRQGQAQRQSVLGPGDADVAQPPLFVDRRGRRPSTERWCGSSPSSNPTR